MFRLLPYTILFFVLSCKAQQNDFKSPAGYDLTKPVKFLMPGILLEISGIVHHNDSLYAIQDEEGRLFYLRAGDEKAGSSKFGNKGDYEDLSLARNQFIVLRSDGSLFSFPLGQSRSEEITSTREWNGLVPKGEYEGLYADDSDGRIYVLCKDCKQDKKSDATSIFILQLQADGSIVQSGSASIAVKKRKFQPSAITKNPRTQEWYILSSSANMLAVADSKWNIKATYALDPGLFRQPEGIAFDKQNNLYISNEGDATSNGNVLQFVFKTN